VADKIPDWKKARENILKQLSRGTISDASKESIKEIFSESRNACEAITKVDDYRTELTKMVVEKSESEGLVASNDIPEVNSVIDVLKEYIKVSKNCSLSRKVE